ncbi:NADPH-dependent FMN reductase [Cryobacterium melibiosiphilum]|uniref:NADPH-dependent FMN reductase n=1 Tax=Cryobacterium melibiosiphilum TaxID=995039 RepID=A0A3A5MBS4_9MICO|nr:FMN reductase [Cryobacterium melibiosiphilum]RJT86123.1 NADPH-dependent FMN reductase [Cryobacterium melibiosiphilum]
MTAPKGKQRTLAVVSAGLSQPSSTRLLADKLAAATVARLVDENIETRVVTYELRDYAQDVMNNMLTGFASPRLETMIDAVTAADGLIAVTPIFTTSYSGLFKSFFDVIDNRSLTDQPVLIGATAGTARHSLALDFALRPMFTYLHAVVVPTSVFAASEDWGSGDARVATLPARIERAAGELAALVARSDRSARVLDPFELPAGFNPAGLGPSR